MLSTSLRLPPTSVTVVASPASRASRIAAHASCLEQLLERLPRRGFTRGGGVGGNMPKTLLTAGPAPAVARSVVRDRR